ncbi:MAG: hypothetical protein DMG06_22950, partial [Acidobacteria bacterium]
FCAASRQRSGEITSNRDIVLAASTSLVGSWPRLILKVHKGGSPGLCSTQKGEVNAELLAFLKT